MSVISANEIKITKIYYEMIQEFKTKGILEQVMLNVDNNKDKEFNTKGFNNSKEWFIQKNIIPGLSWMFVWSNSKKGHDYWERLYEVLEVGGLK